MDINDYVHEYKSKNGIKYKMMSLEYIKLSKDNSVRPKDKIDSKKIEETNLIREDVMKRINNYKEIQNTIFQLYKEVVIMNIEQKNDLVMEYIIKLTNEIHTKYNWTFEQ